MAWVTKLPSGRWQGGYRDATGRKHTRTWPTKQAARAWAHDQESDLRAGGWVDPRLGGQKIGEYLPTWRAGRFVTASTTDTDEKWLRLYVLPHWEGWALNAVTRSAVKAWVRKLLDDGLAPATVNRAVMLLSSIFTAAMEETPPLVRTNPCRAVNAGRSDPKPLRFFTHEEVERIVEHLPEPWATITLVMAWCGLRWEEVAALHGHRVDWLRGRIQVYDVWTNSPHDVDGHGHVGIREYPKSRRSRREVPMPEHVAERLLPYLPADPERLMFTRPDGSPVSYQSFYWNWRGQRPSKRRPAGKAGAVELAGVRYDSPHALRHTAASWLVQDGVSLYVVRDLLGHESFKTTEQYSHLAPDAMTAVEESWRRMRDE